MSSSDKLLSWDVFEARDAPTDIDLLSPSSEAASLVQLLRSNVDAARREAEETKEHAAKPMAEMAVFITQLGAALDRYKDEIPPKAHRHLRVVKDQMIDVLNKAEIKVWVPLEQPFDQVADAVHVVGWRHDERFTAQVVAEVLEPVITHGERLLRAGKVIMGAPLANAAAAEPGNTAS